MRPLFKLRKQFKFIEFISSCLVFWRSQKVYVHGKLVQLRLGKWKRNHCQVWLKVRVLLPNPLNLSFVQIPEFPRPKFHTLGAITHRSVVGCVTVGGTMESWPVWPKKSPNVYKSCPKMISLEKWSILTPLQKLPKNVGDLGKLIVAKCFKKLPKVQ